MILSGYLRMKVIDFNLIRVTIERMGFFVKEKEKKCAELSEADQMEKWERRLECESISNEISIFVNILNTFYDWTSDSSSESQKLNKDIVQLGRELKKII